jgi:hypothetical protein
METEMHKNFDMTLGAIAAMVLDYAAVAFVIGLLALDRWLGIQRGIVLDTLFVLIAVVSVAVWFAGARLTHLSGAGPAQADPGHSKRPDNTGTYGSD